MHICAHTRAAAVLAGTDERPRRRGEQRHARSEPITLVRLTERHRTTDVLGILLQIDKGSNRQPPVGNGPPEVLHQRHEGLRRPETPRMRLTVLMRYSRVSFDRNDAPIRRT